jgi:hypothetical protein
VAIPHGSGHKKRRTREHVIADLSVNFVERTFLRCGFSAERVAHDYGIDLLLFTYNEAGEIENGHVEFQLKGSDRLRLLAGGHSISYSVASADLRYWLFEPMPVILVVYDAKNEHGYWLHIQQYVADVTIRQERWTPEKQTVNVRIPTGNRLTVRAVQRFRALKNAIFAKVQGGAQP